MQLSFYFPSIIVIFSQYLHVASRVLAPPTPIGDYGVVVLHIQQITGVGIKSINPEYSQYLRLSTLPSEANPEIQVSYVRKMANATKFLWQATPQGNELRMELHPEIVFSVATLPSSTYCAAHPLVARNETLTPNRSTDQNSWRFNLLPWNKLGVDKESVKTSFVGVDAFENTPATPQIFWGLHGDPELDGGPALFLYNEADGTHCPNASKFRSGGNMNVVDITMESVTAGTGETVETMW